MSAFADAQTNPKPSLLRRCAARPALMMFLVCLVLGLAVVVWRAKARAATARLQARTEALGRGAALELELSQAVAAAEVLGALARQSGGTVPGFQKVASELLTARPGLASLELQPRGVVSDLVPRAGHEQAIGFNVLTDPTQRVGANAAIQRRVLTVAGPLPLERGEPGIIVRVPVFQRRADGRDYFWGFVAVTMRLSEALIRAGLDELATNGYSYALFAPASALEKPVTVAEQGWSSFQSPIELPVRARNLEFRLALHPHGGWFNWRKAVREFLGVLFVAGLLSLLARLLADRRLLNSALAETRRRLARETDAAAQDRSAALATIVSLQNRLDAAARAAKETAEANAAKLTQLEAENHELRTSLLAAKQAEARVEELTTLLAEAPAQLQCQEDASATSVDPPVAEPVSTAQPLAPETSGELVAPSPATPVPSALSSDTASPPPEPPETKTTAAVAKRKKARRNDQMDLFAEPPQPDQTSADVAADRLPEQPPGSDQASPEPQPAEPTVVATEHPASMAALEPDLPPIEGIGTTEGLPSAEGHPELDLEAPALARPPSAPRPVNPAQLRKSIRLMLPLLTGQDPGAKDCLKANRATFRSAFTPEPYAEFEQLVKSGSFDAALEQLKKVAKKHGVSM